MLLRKLNEKRVLLTGASSGIGEALAWELGKHRARLVLTARRADRLQIVAEKVRAAGGKAEFVVGDITHPSCRDACLAAAEKHFGGLDILINNAGAGAIGPFANASSDRMRHIMELNFLAPADLIRAAIPRLQRGDDPLIVNIGSVLGYRGVPNKSEYCASKFALHGLSDALRAELAALRIGVLLVCPSTTRSEFFEHVLENNGGEGWKPGPGASPESVARHAVWAMKWRLHRCVHSLGGKLLVWTSRLTPWLLDFILAKPKG